MLGIKLRLDFACLVALAFAVPQLGGRAYAECSLNLTSAKPCLAKGQPGIPKLGDRVYGLIAKWKTEGWTQPYRVLFEMGPMRESVDVAPGGTGEYSAWVESEMPLDGKIPYRVILDPDKSSGDDNVGDKHVISGAFTPTPPKQPFEWYEPKEWHGSVHVLLKVAAGSKLTKAKTFLGKPTGGTSQQLLKFEPGPSATVTTMAPAAYPVLLRQFDRPVPGSYANSEAFDVRAYCYRANQAKIDSNWSEVAQAVAEFGLELQPYLNADAVCQSDSDSVRAFVHSILPADYQSKLTPLASARLLFQAVAQRVHYEENASANDAIAVLKSKVANCSGYTRLYVACLRCIGIPARPVDGIVAPSSTHSWTEIYMPRAGWIPQDCTYCSSTCQGSYASYFMVMPDLNERCILSRGSRFTDGALEIPSAAGFFSYSGRGKASWTTVAQLEPKE